MSRKVKITRKTSETEVVLELNLDGAGNVAVRSGIGFFDHLLTLMAFHARMDLTLSARGDLHVDDHHTVEDVGICLGRALDQALGDRSGISRYGFFLLPMDEVLARAVLDLSGRAWLRYQAEFGRPVIGSLATENLEEFFRALVREARCTLHLEILTPGSEHHQAEALFKAFGRALRQALSLTGQGVPSTKGKLE